MIKFYFHKTRVTLSILCLSFIFMITLSLYERHLHQEVEDLQRHLLSLNQLAARTQEAATVINAHETDFVAFEACGFEHPCTPEALQNSYPHTIEFRSSPLGNDYSKTKGVVIHEVSFSIPCLQDRDVFRFLNQLMTKGPGIFYVHEVTITRVSALSEEMLEKIALGKPQALFDGRITATWIHR